MNTDGNMITGTWTNRLNGKTVQVRSSIMDGDNMIIITNDGMIDMNEFSRNYIQISDEVFDQNGNIITTETPNVSEANFFGKDDKPDYTFNQAELDILLGRKKTENELNEVKSTNSSSLTIKTQNENYKYIDKVFSKLTYKPSLKIDIDWGLLPKEKLEMLIDTFDVNPIDIAEYIYDNYFSTDKVLEKIKEQICNITAK